MNSYSEKIPINPNIMGASTLQKIKPIVLSINNMSLNKIEVVLSGNADNESTLHKSRTGSEKSINVDATEEITRMVLNINIAKRKLIFEFDVDRNDDDGMMEEESATHGQNSSMQFNDGQKMRLEVKFKNVEEMDIFSESNSLQFHTSDWKLLEIFQENVTKPITWEDSSVKRLLGRSLAEEESSNLNVKVNFKKGKFGKSLCTRISTLDRMLGAGLNFSVDGRQQRMMNGGIRINAG